MANTSVIVVTYHTGPALWTAIDSILAQQNLAELVVVNNGNPAEVLQRLEVLARDNPRVVLLNGHGNVGFARGCNLGVTRASGDYILLLNPDSVLPPLALLNATQALNDFPGAMMAGCHLVNFDGTAQRGSRRELLTPQNALAETLMLYKFFPGKAEFSRFNQHEAPPLEQVTEVPAISGAFMFIRKADYTRIGGMDEGYFLHVEDMDFCMKVARAGGKTIFIPQITVVHFCSTSDVSSYFVEWNKAAGFKRYFLKYFSQSTSSVVLACLLMCIYVRFLLKSAVIFVRKLKPRIGLNDEEKQVKAMHVLNSYHHIDTNRVALAPKRVMVTGAMSQVGLCIIGRLLKEGADVVALTRKEPIPYENAKFTWLRADFTKDVLPMEHAPSVLVHAASLWLLPERLEYFASLGIKRVIAFSSTSVFVKQDSGNAHEKEIAAKLKQAEIDVIAAAEKLSLEFTLLRPTMIYGVGMDTNVTTVSDQIRNRRFFAICPPGKGLRQPVHADDLALAVLKAIDTPAAYGKSYNLGGQEILTFRQLVERIFIVLGFPVRILPLPFLPQLLDIIGRLTGTRITGEMARRMNRDLVFDITPAETDFSYSPRPFLSGGQNDL